MRRKSYIVCTIKIVNNLNPGQFITTAPNVIQKEISFTINSYD